MPNALEIALKNDSDLPNIHAYITGLAIQQSGKRCLLKSNGKDLYFPSEVQEIGTPLQENCAIPLGPPGTTTHITIPQIAGGRIWIAEGELKFLLNPGGPALVEPSVLNPSDPNAGVNFGFAEFTLNDEQLYANISYVDFVPRIPIAITLQQRSGEVQHVAGMAADGIDRMAESLKQQAGKDGRPWDKLVVERDGRVLRILNATHGGAVGASFDGYFEPLVEEVWRKYGKDCKCRVNTQAGPGVLEGHVNHAGKLKIGDEEFDKPSSADILGCNSGPFTTGPSPTRNAIIPRLAAAFVRSSIIETEDHPSQPSTFYNRDPTNHYARLVHEHNVDKKGYAFAYDDVQPDGGDDQSGKVNAGDPVLFTVTVGGKNAQAGQGGAAAPHPQQLGGYQRGPPPPPPGTDGPQDQNQGRHGLGGKLFGFAKDKAKGFMHR
ncbi:glycoside hydrolase family 64 protein [Pseudocercospora fijiensis CIRAD86]|uniref:Glycoside hydrolase family 64 protein n=1 Tax=Pseudocercospora fijiensis (strain CIRAD86) TaxID=383855 RepID=M3AXJ5_PSEFD|nr:glycoside hydrolase family 64 protein [Pseudocercospora fijiensis CIRAD86]EME81818.1 glycoside hydrolase family 64 protein [Pseudocercospora fijiensis CIRAD86]